MKTIDASKLPETPNKITCDCGMKISTLPPDKSWRKVLCTCGIIWWVKPSGRRFERPRNVEDIDYGR